METVAEAPVQAQTEAPAPQSTPVEAQTQVQTEAPNQTPSDGATVDRASRLTEINALIAADPDKKLNDEDLSIYMEGQEGKLKPKVEESIEKPKVEAPKENDPIQKAMKDLGAKTPEELSDKIAGLRKELSGKTSQDVARLSKEVEGFKSREAAFTGATKFIEDLKAGKPGAFEYLQKELGVQLPKAQDDKKPFTDEADLLTDGALSRQWEENKALREKMEGLERVFGEGQKAKEAEALQQRSAAQIVEEALTVAALMPDFKDLPNLRGRIVAFQQGADDPGLAPLSEVFDYVIGASKKGLSLDPETAFYAIKGKNMAAEIAAAEERGRKQAYNHKKNPSLSSIAAEDTQTKEYTAQDMANWEKDFNTIPKEFFDKNMDLDVNRIPEKYRKVFGLG
jgi:hypothetical protein